MSTDQDKQPRFRSPPFPYIGLGKALQRTEQLYEAVRHHSAAIPTAAKAWGTGAKSSATLQSIGALIQYGLLDDEGSGPNRRIKLTPLARRIVMDKRPNSTEKARAIREAALKPATFKELFERYGAASEIDESLLLHSLTAERVQEGRAPYSDQSAQDVIRIFKETVSFSDLRDDRTEGSPSRLADSEEEREQDAEEQPKPDVGARIQWVSGGVAQFPEPRTVRALSADAQWVFVEGSETGIPIEEIEIFETADERLKREPPTLPLPNDEEKKTNFTIDPRERGSMKVVWSGHLIRIEATVDKVGLAQLRKKLDAMEALLEDEDDLL